MQDTALKSRVSNDNLVVPQVLIFWKLCRLAPKETDYDINSETEKEL